MRATGRTSGGGSLGPPHDGCFEYAQWQGEQCLHRVEAPCSLANRTRMLSVLDPLGATSSALNRPESRLLHDCRITAVHCCKATMRQLSHLSNISIRTAADAALRTAEASASCWQPYAVHTTIQRHNLANIMLQRHSGASALSHGAQVGLWELGPFVLR